MNPKKVYTIDPAVTHRLGFNFSRNKGRVLENMIFIELLRRGKEVYYHTGKNECDFLVKEGLKITQAIQVVYAIDKTNQQREISGLKEAMQTYGLSQGLLITSDTEDEESDASGTVKTIPAWKWMLKEEQRD